MAIVLVALFSFVSISFSNGQPFSAAGKPKGKNPFEKEWKNVDSLMNLGLPKSAFEVIRSIYKKASAEKNSPQIIKSIIYRLRVQQDFQEGFLDTAITQIRQEISIQPAPDKQVLHSILAELYWQYYQMNRYRFMDRTTVAENKEEDISTWDLSKILNTTIYHYRQSLTDALLLKKTPILEYEPILIKPENYNRKETSTLKARPTLYDFLAFRAFDFFAYDEPGLIKPAITFQISSPEYFSSIADFISLQIITPDTGSMKYHAIRLLQDIISFHQGDADPLALIDANLKRLEFVRQNGVMEQKDSLYLHSLIAFKNTVTSTPFSTWINDAIATEYVNRAQGYQPFSNTSLKDFYIKALEYCEDAIQSFPESDGANNCKIIRDQILKPVLLVAAENVILPGKPFLSLVTYKNLHEVWYRIIRIKPETDKGWKEQMTPDELIKKYLSTQPFKEGTFKLPDDGDHHLHSAEINLPSLETGYYLLLVSGEQDFSTENNPISYQPFFVSRISYIDRRNNDGSIDLFVADRETGLPIQACNIQTYYQEYDYSVRRYVAREWMKFLTDDEGFVTIPIPPGREEYRSFFMNLSKETDYLTTDDSYYVYPVDRSSPVKVPVTYFFTDRAIYRPGQTVYFKGILLEKNGDDYSIAAGRKTKVTFYDVNDQIVSEKELVSNDYGSIHGEFITPSGVLTGQMRIANESGSTYFSVEEYKRPKFEVDFNPVEGSYKLNETVSLTGTAKAYAGSNLSGAQVKYRVVRTAYFPYWRYFWFDFFPSSPETEIINGVTTTDDNGLFTVTFKAIPDPGLSWKYSPTFNYTVYADVTDINGETHSGTASVSVGYQALLLSVNIPEKVDLSDPGTYKIISTNLNGIKENTTGSIEVLPINQPERLMIARKWQRPDRFIMSREEFLSKFPLHVYDDEDNSYLWPERSAIWQKEFNTATDSLVRISGLKEGLYVLKIRSTDKFGTPVESKHYFVAFNPSSKKLPVNNNTFFVITGKEKVSYEPGEKLNFLLGSREESIRVLYEISYGENKIIRNYLNIDNGVVLQEIPILEVYRGNLSVNLTWIRNNRSYTTTKLIQVPFANKKLDFRYMTFRDKIQPGSKEEWRIHIEGAKGEKIAAELLAGMYDASLDAFVPHGWYFSLFPSWSSFPSWSVTNAFSPGYSNLHFRPKELGLTVIQKQYCSLNWFGLSVYHGKFDGRYKRSMALGGDVMESTLMTPTTAEQGMMEKPTDDEGRNISDKDLQDQTVTQTVQKKPVDFSGVQVRKDFRETAFFFPDLLTDPNGDVILRFTAPEALTRWKLMCLAYTKDLMTGYSEKEIVTQKELMVTPNMPRFFRQGDAIVLEAKIANLSDSELEGMARLEFFDAVTTRPVNDQSGNMVAEKPFSVGKGKNTMVNWNIQIPVAFETGAIQYRIVARAGNFSDGEEAIIPVLTNRMMVTESLPLPIRGLETRKFEFGKLINSKNLSSSLTSYRLTLEFTSNPAWYAVQALPVLADPKYENADNLFTAFYANSIAAYIANSNPKIKRVFESWQKISPDALLSNLEKNQELKSVILQETPWLLEARSESEQKKRIALLFDLNNMARGLNDKISKLEKLQVPNGGWSWFAGMPDNRYITQYIVTGFGHLHHLGVRDVTGNPQTYEMLRKAIYYLDERIREDYLYLKKHYPEKLQDQHIGQTQIQYLYARSYFLEEFEPAARHQEAFDYYTAQAKKYWLNTDKYMQGMIALALYRLDDQIIPASIIRSLKEKSLHSDELGMYWAENAGFYWYEAPIETQALMIEAFDEVAKDSISVEEMKIWLLKQKQTQDWKTGRATAEACYALLLRGTDLLAGDEQVAISLGTQKINPFAKDPSSVEPGTGYFKQTWSGGEIKPEMGNVTVTKEDQGVAWGALYWQYFEDLDKITPHKTPLKLEKKLFLEMNSPSGPVLTAIDGSNPIHTGDKIKVRIILRVDRDMEFVHMKDMRAASFEPVNVLSGYRYQDGLGYYESTGDVATNFFFDYLRKGTYVFEYPVIAGPKGDFSNGITTIQCMYAPEFSAHSEGIRVGVE